MQANQPIGVFDSGLGGLSIWKEITSLLPNENTIYLADSKNAPYGEKSTEAIIDLSIKNTELLLKQNCKIIVVACNTATTNAIDILRGRFDVPFIGIEPAIKPAALNSKTNKIGVLATKGTLSSHLFQKTSEIYRDQIEFVEVEGKGLVKLIEQGKVDATYDLLTDYLGRMIDVGVDKIVLGCSHYPFLLPIINQILPDGIEVIDSGMAVARQTNQVLERENALRKAEGKSSLNFYTNKDKEIARLFFQSTNLISNLGLNVEIDYLDF